MILLPVLSAWLSLLSIPWQRASGLTRSFGRQVLSTHHPPHTTLSSGLHIISERPSSGNGKVLLLPEKPCQEGAPQFTNCLFNWPGMRCHPLGSHSHSDCSPSLVPEIWELLCLCLCLTLTLFLTRVLPSSPAREMGRGKSPKVPNLKSDLFLSPSSLPNNYTCVKLMLYITKRETSLERVQSDNF